MPLAEQSATNRLLWGCWLELEREPPAPEWMLLLRERDDGDLVATLGL